MSGSNTDLLRKIKELEEENKALKADLSKEISDAIEFASQTSSVADSWEENMSEIYEEQNNKDQEIKRLKEQINAQEYKIHDLEDEIIFKDSLVEDTQLRLKTIYDLNVSDYNTIHYLLNKRSPVDGNTKSHGLYLLDVIGKLPSNVTNVYNTNPRKRKRM